MYSLKESYWYFRIPCQMRPNPSSRSQTLHGLIVIFAAKMTLDAIPVGDIAYC